MARIKIQNICKIVVKCRYSVNVSFPPRKAYANAFALQLKFIQSVKHFLFKKKNTHTKQST